jgi:hypothetical protein
MRASCAIRLHASLAVFVLLAGCVQINRFRYISLESIDGIHTEGSVLPSSVHCHFVSVEPMPPKYTLSRADYSVQFTRAETRCPGGVLISAISADGAQLEVLSDEPPLSVPGYGACRAYYPVKEPPGLLFFDDCPGSLDRAFDISFTIVDSDGTATKEQVVYDVRKNGFWWTLDLL